jgi:hypothetical protein
MPDMPMTLLQAMARAEGFYVDGTRAARNRNPGNIEWGKFSRAHGATQGDPRFAIFPDEATGFACMRALLQSAYEGMTIRYAISKWAPDSENDTQSYLNNVCRWTGLCQCAVIDDHLV